MSVLFLLICGVVFHRFLIIYGERTNKISSFGEQVQVLDIVILMLATWRLSSLLVNPEDDGPWEMFGKFRYLVGVRRDEASGIFYGKNVLAQGLLCAWCSSVWLGIAITISYIFFPSIMVMASLPFALSAGAIVLERIING